jgi:hypothetical protein
MRRALAYHGADVLNLWTANDFEMDFNYYSANLGMHSAIMDFRRPGEMARFPRLVTDADVFFANRRPGLLEKLGITSSELARLRPGSCKSISRSMGLSDPGPTELGSIIRLAAFPGCSRSLSSPRRPDSTMRIFSSAENCRQVARLISFTTCSAGSLTGPDFCPIFAPSMGYDGPEILPSSTCRFCGQ